MRTLITATFKLSRSPIGTGVTDNDAEMKEEGRGDDGWLDLFNAEMSPKGQAGTEIPGGGVCDKP